MTIPDEQDFKQHFFRDFPFGDESDLDYVGDRDISKAIKEAKVNINQDLFADQCEFELGFLYLTAHYLVMDLRASSQGLSGQYSWLQQSKSVGSVSESFGIPQKILDNPIFAMLSKTNYGAKYLSLILPKMTGAVFAICGDTRNV